MKHKVLIELIPSSVEINCESSFVSVWRKEDGS